MSDDDTRRLGALHIEAMRKQWDDDLYPCSAEFYILCNMALRTEKAERELAAERKRADEAERRACLLEHPRSPNEKRDEIEMFLRDAYAAGCHAASSRSLFTAMEYAKREAPKLRNVLGEMKNG